jgi:hypothetical protein
MKVSVTRIDLLLVENARSITKLGNEGVPRIDLLLVENNQFYHCHGHASFKI